ncbi:hypothetical protein HZA41_02480 [Candidatus Peregrinibacteria bacterium]|nr:hypothetical protein [Candidatus Peregrinibacteria bacterium]
MTTPNSLSDAQLALWQPDSENPDYKLYVADTHKGENNTATNFYRQIQISYPDNTTLSATSTVVWFEKGQKKKIKRAILLFNYVE